MPEEEWMREVEAQWTELTNVFFPLDLIMGCVDPQLGELGSPYGYSRTWKTLIQIDFAEHCMHAYNTSAKLVVVDMAFNHITRNVTVYCH